ncbi:MAG: MtrB/PioB family decaheme-associated outer membrane protein [Gammaproteobacteria bacterium]
MRTSVLMCFPVILASNTPVSAQPQNQDVDTSQWQCKWCPGDERKVEADVKGGLGYVTNDSYKFGDYTGLNEKGVYVLADADASGRNEKGAYFDLQARNLGLDSRSIEVEGGKQGRAQFDISYDQLPKLNSDTARTPYTGDSVQQLPLGWVTAANTSGMTALSSSLRDVNLSTERRRTRVGASFFQTPALSYDLNYQHETKKGNRSAGLGFGFSQNAILAIPVDYESDIASVGVNYNTHRWQASVNYQLSAFKNNNESIRWQNAFSTPANTPEGQAALEPENKMQMLAVNGSYKITDSILLAALLSYGEMRQNQQYLPITINSNITSPLLPRTSLDGKINTLDANLNLHAGITEKLNLQFQYNQHEQDNTTPRATYLYIIADTPPANPNDLPSKTNLPYSFRQQELQGEVQYRFNRQHKLSGGADYEIYDRTYQEVDKTKEYRLWGLYNALFNKWDLKLRLDYADRKGDDYKPLEDTTQNPLMRKYNMADRIRNRAGLSLQYSPLHSLDLGFNAGLSKDDYKNSSVGLKESNESSFSVDLRYIVIEPLTLRALYALTNIDSTQAEVDWQAKNDDRMDVFDLGLIYKLMADKLNIGFDYTFAKSSGNITVANSGFPELTTERHTFKIHGDYNMSKRSYLIVGYLFEKYDEKNWAIDDLTVDSIGNVLTLGEKSPSYDIGYFTVSYQYNF